MEIVRCFIIFTLVTTKMRNRIIVDGEPNLPMMKDGIEIFEHINKSPHDHRSYRGLKLANDLKVLLISDRTTDTSAASLTIGTGLLRDPPDMLGLANYLAHLLVRGDRKSDFQDFLKAHDGSTGYFPRVTENEQIFSFQIESTSLNEALEKFSRFFLTPKLDKLTEKVLEDTLLELESKFLSSKTNDNFWLFMTEKSLGRKDHAFTRLFSGNWESLFWIPLQSMKNNPTLKKQVRHRQRTSDMKLYTKEILPTLLKYHSSWYSSNIMSLVVVGNENLDQLQEMVVPLFKDIENKDKKRLRCPFDQQPWGSEQLKREVYIVPPTHQTRLRLLFPVPSQKGHYKTKPRTYISYLLKANGPGTLLTILKERKLCTNFVVDYYDATGIAYYTMICYLTEYGLEKKYDIITLIFQYIHFLKVHGVQKSIFDEGRKLDEIQFLHEPPNESLLTYTQKLSQELQDYPMDEILSYSFITNHWNESLIQDFLAHLRPDNMIILVIDEGYKDFANKTERWYKTPYRDKKIPEKLIQIWKDVNHTREMKLLPANEFVPDNFDLYFEQDKDDSTEPHIIHESSISRFWFKQDSEFKIPKIAIPFEIHCPVVHMDPSRYLMLYVFYSLLMDFMEEQYLYTASSAGIQWDFDLHYVHSKIEVYFSGFDDKISVILEKFVSFLLDMEFVVDNDMFEEEKQHTILESCEGTIKYPLQKPKQLLNDIFIINLQFVNYWKTFNSEDYGYQFSWYLRHLLDEYSWGVADILSTTKDLQFDDWKKFIREMSSRIFLHGLITGNCSIEKAKEIVQILERPFQLSRGLLPQEILPPRPALVEEGAHFTYLSNTQPNVYVYCACYQYDPDSNRSQVIHVISLLFEMIINEACQKLIAEEDNFTSQCESATRNGVGSFFFRFRSYQYLSYSYLDTRMENFLLIARDLLNDIKREEFEKFKRKLERKHFSEASTLKEQTDFYWREIRLRSYDFEGPSANTEHLLFLSKKDLLGFFSEVFEKSSPKRRKVAFYIFPEDTKLDIRRRTPREATIITDFTTFKNTSSLHSLSDMFIEIDPLGTKN